MELLKAIWTVYTFLCVGFTTFFLIGLARSLRTALKTEKTVKDIKQSIKLVYIEKANDICYMYDGLTNSFITQAATEDEMWRNAKLRFPDKEFIIKGDSGNATVVSVNVKGAQ